MDRTKTPKLFIVKGKRQPTIRQLPTISWSEMNDGDVFVLEAVSHIFIWVGRKANRLERLQGCKVRVLNIYIPKKSTVIKHLISNSIIIFLAYISIFHV